MNRKKQVQGKVCEPAGESGWAFKVTWDVSTQCAGPTYVVCLLAVGAQRLHKSKSSNLKCRFSVTKDPPNFHRSPTG